ncbi:MAG: 4Fe-4S dicluster domain-containing protein [Planctomycetes bacterium]|nr:4Fe-4S dicluster domain-containing protein [Planctomycetota bacterium]
MDRFRYLPGVVTLQIDVRRCDGCRMCVIVCPHAVFCMQDKKARILDADACMECGACAKNCPSGAITVRSGVGCATAMLIETLHRGSCCGG